MDSDQPLYQDFGRLLLFPMSVIFGSGRYERTSNVTRENISHYMRRGAPAGDHFVSLRERAGNCCEVIIVQTDTCRFLECTFHVKVLQSMLNSTVNCSYSLGFHSCAVAKAISYRSLTSEAQVRSRSLACGIWL